MKTASTAAVVLLLAMSAGAQDLINDSGFDAAFVFTGDTNQPGSNQAWEWLGAADWWLYGWPNGDGEGKKYYNGQYGPNKAPRDFTGQAPNAWNPVPGGTPGLVRAHLTDTLIFGGGVDAAAYISRQAKAEAPSDYFARFSNFDSQAHYVTSESVQANTRLLLKLDYIAQGTRTVPIAMLGMLDNNLQRTPYVFDSDIASAQAYNGSTPADALPLKGVAAPGPDIAFQWGGGKQWNGYSSTGQPIGSVVLPAVAEWTTVQMGFTVPTPDIARTGDAGKTSFDNIDIEITSLPQSEQIRGLDNLHLYVLLGGDADESGTVDLADLAILATNWNTAEAMDWTTGDFTNDGAVDLADLAVLATNWNQTADGFVVASSGMSFADAVAAVGLSVVPEPATLSLLGLGALGLLRRRR